jgi:hypothetical protein
MMTLPLPPPAADAVANWSILLASAVPMWESVTQCVDQFL